MRSHGSSIWIVASFAVALVPALAFSADHDYVIRDRMQIMKPVSLEAMNNDSQSAVLIQDLGSSVIVDITYHPLMGPQAVSEDPDWRAHDAGMTEYLKPGITANWDVQLQKDLLAQLGLAGIDPSKLTDKALVDKVSNWLLKNFSGKAPFIAYYVEFKDGKPFVPVEMRAAFDEEKKNFGLQTDEEVFNHGLFGKGLFYSRIHGSCTPSSILWTTVFRALGIPTRIVETLPPVDANDPVQLAALADAVNDNSVRAALIEGVGTAAGSTMAWANHSFVEVFVGGQWVRLNYNRLGQPLLDPVYFGLLTVVNRISDWSESGLPSTWGLHNVTVSAGGANIPGLTSVNPYRSLKISDNLDSLPGFSNPSGPLPIPLTVTIDHAWVEGDPTMPSQIANQHLAGFKLIFLNIKEKTSVDSSKNSWMKFLYSALSPQITLTSDANQVTLSSLATLTYEATATSPYQGFVLWIPENQLKEIQPGTTYSLSLKTAANNQFAIDTSPELQIRTP